YPKPGERRNVSMQTEALGLLKDGATIADANASSRRVAEILASVDPAVLDGTASPTSFETARLLDDMVAPIRPALVMLGAGTTIVLLAVCVSLAGLLLARNTARQRELAVRLALGA